MSRCLFAALLYDARGDGGITMDLLPQLDDFWRDALRTDGHDNQRKYAALMSGLQAQVAHLPQEEQDKLFFLLAVRNAEYIATARESKDALKVRLGVLA